MIPAKGQLDPHDTLEHYIILQGGFGYQATTYEWGHNYICRGYIPSYLFVKPFIRGHSSTKNW